MTEIKLKDSNQVVYKRNETLKCTYTKMTHTKLSSINQNEYTTETKMGR